MAQKTLYLLGSLASGSGFLGFQDGGSAPADALTSPMTGWETSAYVTAGTDNDAAEVDAQTERPNSSFAALNTSTHPGTPNNTLGNGWITAQAYTGDFAAANWTLGVMVRSNSGAFDGRLQMRWRVFRTASATGASPTEITSGAVISSQTTANLSTSTFTAVSATWACPGFSLQGERILTTCAIHTPTASTATFVFGTSKDVILGVGSNARIITSDFSLPEQIGGVHI